jgi:hypothetical protein
VCTSVTAVKYLYKYVYKGHDRAQVQVLPVNPNNALQDTNPPPVAQNEIQEYLDGRYVGAAEAAW